MPTRDKASRLRLTLACLVGEVDDRTEVVVVDDGSSDATGEVLREAAAHLPLRVVAGGGLGRAGARNLGAAHARGDQLVFLDDDVLVGKGFVAAPRLRAPRPVRAGPVRPRPVA
jgi:glycosyltransferase involved in cell wall biosynthesis